MSIWGCFFALKLLEVVGFLGLINGRAKTRGLGVNSNTVAVKQPGKFGQCLFLFILNGTNPRVLKTDFCTKALDV